MPELKELEHETKTTEETDIYRCPKCNLVVSKGSIRCPTCNAILDWTQIAQTLLLNEMRKNLEILNQKMMEVKESVDSTIPEGIYLEGTFDITDEYTPIYFHDRPDLYPIHDFSIFNNDGSGDVYIMVNDSPVSQTPIKATESLHVDMKAKKIYRIIVYCSSGETATVRIHALR